MSSLSFLVLLTCFFFGCVCLQFAEARERVPAGVGSFDAFQQKEKKTPRSVEEFVQKEIFDKFGPEGTEKLVRDHQNRKRQLSNLENLLFEKYRDLEIDYKVISAIRSGARTTWTLANSTTLSGLVELEGETSAQDYVTNYIWVNELAAIFAVNPILGELNNLPLLRNKAVTIYLNQTELDAVCASSAFSWVSLGSGDGCVAYDTPTTPVVRLAFQSDSRAMLDNMLRAFVLLLEPFANPSLSHGPFSSSPVAIATAIETYDACLNLLAHQIYGGNFPYTQNTPLNTLQSRCDNANFRDGGFLFCYDGAPFSKQGAVPASKYCTNATSNTCSSEQNCVNDGSCTEANRCNYRYCEFSDNFCDSIFCFDIRSRVQCCSIDFTTSNWTFCPPLNSDQQDFTVCVDANSCENPQTSEVVDAGESEGGSCFIATAAYGSPMDNNVWYLRRFRDEYLLTNFLGKQFVDLYYRYSPPVANFIAKSETLKTVTRFLLTPLVELAKIAA